MPVRCLQVEGVSFNFLSGVGATDRSRKVGLSVGCPLKHEYEKLVKAMNLLKKKSTANGNNFQVKNKIKF